jgi:hypothetical protein
MATAMCDEKRVAGFYFRKARGSWLLGEEGVIQDEQPQERARACCATARAGRGRRRATAQAGFSCPENAMAMANERQAD